jgi:hypothetical protein
MDNAQNYYSYINIPSLQTYRSHPLVGLIAGRNVFPLRYEHYSSYALKNDRTMDIIQNCDSYINMPSSQTYRQH